MTGAVSVECLRFGARGTRCSRVPTGEKEGVNRLRPLAIGFRVGGGRANLCHVSQRGSGIDADLPPLSREW